VEGEGGGSLATRRKNKNNEEGMGVGVAIGSSPLRTGGKDGGGKPVHYAKLKDGIK